MEIVNFNKCTLAFMEKRAHLSPQSASESMLLKAWINTNIPLSELDEHIIRMFSSHLDMNAFHWREYDLSMHFKDACQIVRILKQLKEYCIIRTA